MQSVDSLTKTISDYIDCCWLNKWLGIEGGLKSMMKKSNVSNHRIVQIKHCSHCQLMNRSRCVSILHIIFTNQTILPLEITSDIQCLFILSWFNVCQFSRPISSRLMQHFSFHYILFSLSNAFNLTKIQHSVDI